MTRKRPAPPPAAEPQPDLTQVLQQAYAHWNAGQAAQAEMLARRVLEAWPGQADALHLLGLIAHAYGKLELAVEYLRGACQAPRAPAVYFSNLAEMCRQQGLLAEAEAAGRQATRLAPELPTAWNNLGIVLQECGRYDESATCLERVVAILPDSPEAHNNLGNTYKRAGRLADARAEYGKALALHPAYAEAHSNLAFLLSDLGEYAEAAEAAQLAIDYNPRLADAYINMAGIEAARQRPDQALHWIEALLAFAPLHAGGLLAKARLLLQCGQLQAALEAAGQAVAAAPQNADAYNMLGEAQQAQDRFEEALDSFDRAMSLPGIAREAAWLNRARLLMILGRAGEARAVLDGLLACYPDNAQAWSARADMTRFERGDPAIDAMETLLREDRVGDVPRRTALRFALGKAYMDCGATKEAWAHLVEANREKRASFDFDIGVATGGMTRIADAFTALPASAQAGNASDLPVFIVGMPRSGTTLVEQILASHSRVHGAGELPLMRDLVSRIAGFPEGMAQADPSALDALGDACVKRLAALSMGKDRVIDRTPSNFLYAGLIARILPRARIIHCRRDPVDTCLSCFSKPFGAEHAYSCDLVELGRYYRAYDALMACWRRILPADRYIEVDYEALVDDPEGQSRRLVEFLGLHWEPACLAYHRSPRPVRGASMNEVRQPIYRHAKGRWRAYAHYLGPLLSELGVEAT
ncbi:tetratricopeptide repeat-containing sulfotransferase family protein [Bordetella genomosp. 11]|uniref:Uncharacterized protein n=1 Tax=Bordetella genomosp. 11 TaxID=1416808 RepID=A0A261ULE4_9BORD|nr:tetratricopeptide repeat-containing sulfotransferase family protein [Bordetella genomosp. 11]OZI62451.1 hypothetical protein CAL28_25075 [Bordetella genomosp. 11]